MKYISIMLFVAVITLLLFSGENCTKIPTPDDTNTGVLVSLVLSPQMDTLFLSSQGESRTFTLSGNYVEESKVNLENRGAISSATFTITTSDTSLQSVANSSAIWYSSNTSVARVSNGTITAVGTGTALIYAEKGGIQTSQLPVKVNLPTSPPGLTLDPPLVCLIFQNSIAVSGTVQLGSSLQCAESRSGFSQAVIFNANGKFSTTVTGLQTGSSTISVTATRSSVSTRKNKYVTYYTLFSAGADSIVGTWNGKVVSVVGGQTVERPFTIYISKNALLPRYDVQGTLDIEFFGFGLIRDIQIPGLIGSDGKIQLTLTKSYNGVTISGTMSGIFSNTGRADGSINAKAQKTGWPDISVSLTWYATKAS